jgi:hypothetical protein
MATVVTKASKGSALTNTELDANFNNLNNAKYQYGSNIRVANYSSAPSGSNGALYYNTGNSSLYAYCSGAWRKVTYL